MPLRCEKNVHQTKTNQKNNKDQGTEMRSVKKASKGITAAALTIMDAFDDDGELIVEPCAALRKLRVGNGKRIMHACRKEARKPDVVTMDDDSDVDEWDSEWSLERERQREPDETYS